MPPIAPVDTSSFNPTQLAAFTAANKLGTGVQTYDSSKGQAAPVVPSQPPPKVPDQPAKPVTTFSSDTASNYASDNAQKLATLKQTGLTVGPDGLARFSDSSFATAPTDATQNEDGTWQAGGVKYAIGPSTTQDPELQAINDQITQMKTQFDTTSRANIDNIKQQFDKLIKEQGDINTRSTASLDQSLLMGGSSRYAQESSNGAHTAIMTYGLGKIADLNTQEQSAIIQAQQAQDAGDMKLMDQALNLAQKARDEKQTAAKDLSAKLVKANDDLKAKKTQASQEQAVAGIIAQGVTDPSKIQDMMNNYDDGSGTGANLSLKAINDMITNLSPDAKNIMELMQTARNNNAPDSVVKAIGASKSYKDAFTAAGNFGSTATGDMGLYQSYMRDAIAAGQTPSSFSTWQSANEYNKAYASAKGSAMGKAAGGGDNPPPSTDYSMFSPAAQSALKSSGFTSYSADTQSLASQLVEGRMAPSDLSKRTSGAGANYNQILTAADKYSMATTGKHFDIAQANRDYKFANNVSTQNTLNYLGSLVGSDNGSGNLQGGNLDQLIQLSDNRLVKPDGILGAGSTTGQGLPALNNAEQWAKINAGDPQMAGYYATITEVADQIAKILQGGGSGSGTSDAKLRQAQDLFQKGFTPDQVKAVAGSLKGLLANRATSMVKDNPYLSDYADQFGITKGADGHISTNSQMLQQETDAENKLGTFYNSSPENAALIDDIHKQFPDMSAYEVQQKLGI